MSKTPTPIRDSDGLEAALGKPLAVLYKHSPLCGLSALAARQVEQFMRSRPDVPVYQVDVVRDRALSRELARRLATRHESPQALVLRAGDVVWSGSHGNVTAAALAGALDAGRRAGETSTDREETS